MTPEAITLMRHNLEVCERQMLALADKAQRTDDAATFVKGAATYRRIRCGLPSEDRRYLKNPDILDNRP